MNHILLVDDDEIFRPALQKNLENLGYLVVTAVDGKAAQDILLKQRFDLVISDIRMPEVDGMQLLKFIRSNFETPVILMTGFAEILETKQAHELGANDFIAKPFDRSDLVKALSNCLGQQKLKELLEPAMQEQESDKFCRLSIDDFTSGHQIKFNIFLKLSDTKFVKIAHKGEDVSIDRIRDLKVKGLDFFYLRREDFRSYLGFNVHLTKHLIKNGAIEREKRLNLLRHTGQVIAEQIRYEGVDEELYEDSSTFIRSALDLLTEDSDVLDLLDMFNRHADFLYTHSIAVSVYSVMMAKEMRWILPSNNFKVAIGGLLHDIGKKELDRTLLMKPRMQWTADEVKAYESHPARGAEILRKIKSVPEDIVQITYEHHEDCLAQGFPARLRKSQIHPMAKLIAVASEFCNLVMKSPNGDPMAPHEAINKMNRISSARLDSNFFSALKSIFKYKGDSKLSG